MYQYVIVVRRPVQYVTSEKPQCFFKNYMNKKSVIEFVARLDTTLKVDRIFKLNIDGTTVEMTVGFNDGQLDVVEK